MPKDLAFKLMSIVLALSISLMLAMGCGDNGEGVTEATMAVDFVMDYDSALVIAQEKEQKILIDFYTEWCTWCKTLDTLTYVDSSVIELSKTMVFAKIDADIDSVTAEKYSVQGFPTIVLADADGTEIDRIGGYLPPDEFIETVNNYLQDIGTLNDYLRKADTNATTEVNFVLGEKYGDRGMNDKAISYYEKVVSADPDHKDSLTADAMISIGSIMFREKEFDKSFAQFKKVIREYKGSETAADAELWIGYVYRKKGDTTSAIKTYEDFVKNHPDSPDTSYALKQIEKLQNPPSPEEGT